MQLLLTEYNRAICSFTVTVCSNEKLIAEKSAANTCATITIFHWSYRVNNLCNFANDTVDLCLSHQCVHAEGHVLLWSDLHRHFGMNQHPNRFLYIAPIIDLSIALALSMNHNPPISSLQFPRNPNIFVSNLISLVAFVGQEWEIINEIKNRWRWHQSIFIHAKISTELLFLLEWRENKSRH